MLLAGNRALPCRSPCKIMLSFVSFLLTAYKHAETCMCNPPHLLAVLASAVNDTHTIILVTVICGYRHVGASCAALFAVAAIVFNRGIHNAPTSILSITRPSPDLCVSREPTGRIAPTRLPSNFGRMYRFAGVTASAAATTNK